MIVTKVSAAKSQLESAILLWFNEGDPVSMHALAVAAQDCYRVIGEHKGIPSAFQKWAESQSKGFQKKLHDAQNFFKHGPNRFKGKVHLLPRHTEVLMFDAVLCHNLVFNEFPPLMWLYALRFALENPNLVAIKFDPFIRESLEIHKVGRFTRQELLVQLLPHLKEAYRNKLHSEIPPES
jgi:hypothetical protein